MERKEPDEFRWPEPRPTTCIAHASPTSAWSSPSRIVLTSTPAASATAMTATIRYGGLYLLDHYIERISREGHIECLEKNKVAVEAEETEVSISLVLTAYLIEYKKSGIVASVRPVVGEKKPQATRALSAGPWGWLTNPPVADLLWKVSYETHETQIREVEKSSQVISILEEIKNLEFKYKSKAASLTKEDVSELAELLAKDAAA